MPFFKRRSLELIIIGKVVGHSLSVLNLRPLFAIPYVISEIVVIIPYDSDSLSTLIEKHSLKNHALIVYCSSAHCNAAEVLAEKLRRLGCKKVSLYPGGWEEWLSGREGDGVK